jgi:hypothetical protein
MATCRSLSFVSAAAWIVDASAEAPRREFGADPDADNGVRGAQALETAVTEARWRYKVKEHRPETW